MASFLPKSDPAFHVTVTQEEFNLFHKTDRELFTRLVVGLDRDTTKSTHVIAFILWVENIIKDRNIVRNLLEWPDVMLTKLSDEIEIVLDCIESSTFPYGSYSQKVVPLIQTIMHNNVTLHDFHNNRIEIINGITKFLIDVCLRAFADIVQHVHNEKAVKEHNIYLANIYAGFPINPSMQMQPQALSMEKQMKPQVVYFSPSVALVPQQDIVPHSNEDDSNETNTYDDLGQEKHNYQDPYYAYGVSREVNINEDLSSIFAKLDLDSGFVNPDVVATACSGVVAVPVSDDHKKVTMDDRTIFMTFSKGYHISEFEVREFFTRKYGDVVEAMFMQDVQQPEKPLYARLVVYPEATFVIEHFLGGKNGKLKFVINGKHVYARKFICKAPPSPTEAGSSFCQW